MRWRQNRIGNTLPAIDSKYLKLNRRQKLFDLRSNSREHAAFSGSAQTNFPNGLALFRFNVGQAALN